MHLCPPKGTQPCGPLFTCMLHVLICSVFFTFPLSCGKVMNSLLCYIYNLLLFVFKDIAVNCCHSSESLGVFCGITGAGSANCDLSS
jgi:hypothetical protein